MTSGYSVEGKGVSMTYMRWKERVILLDNTSFHVPAGTWAMVCGDNGAGKTTLLRAVSGQQPPTAGAVFIGDAQIDALPAKERVRRVFLVHQNPALGSVPTLTVLENILVAAHAGHAGHASHAGDRTHGISRKWRAVRETRRTSLDLLETVGLQDRASHLTGTLSGGERQLLALLIAQQLPARVLLFDEPLAALDARNRDRCTALISAMHAQGRTILQITHDDVYARTYGEWMLRVGDRRVISEAMRSCITENHVRGIG